jgi:hypothetical protein
MRYVFTVVLLFLAGCAGLDIDGIRLAMIGQEFKAKATGYVGDEKFTERADGSTEGIGVELVNVTKDDTLEIGLQLGYGRGEIQDVDIQTFDVGGAARRFFGEGRLRPYFEGRAGYRRMELQDEDFGRGSSDMFTLGAGFGLQWRATESFSLFGQINYDGAIGDDFDTHGPSLVIGGGWTF